MKLQPEQLEEDQFILIEKLDHQELITFIQKYMKQATFYTRFYNWLTLGLLALLAASGTFAYVRDYLGFSELIAHIGYGVVITFLLIPLHEYIHALAYKYVGAKKVSYDANWRKFYFMAMADRFVANRKEFELVAVAPFVVVSISCCLLFFIASYQWDYTLLTVLFVHTAF